MLPRETGGLFSLQTEAFLAWLDEHGATVHSNVQIVDLRAKNAGRGLIATRNIAEDEELFAIPRSLILTAAALPSHVRSAVDDPWLSLIAAMILELDEGPESFWKPYLDLLPESFDTLMFWSDDELQALQGSAIKNKVGKDKADATFNEQLIPAIGPALKHISRSHLLPLCHRMGSAIMAYGFDLEGPSKDQESNERNNEDDWEEDEDEFETSGKAMIPLADLLNAAADGNNAKLFYEDDKVVMKSIKPIAAGEEIFNDYGPLPTADLVRRYGYTNPNYAIYDVVEIDIELIRATAISNNILADGDASERMEYLDEQSLLDDGYDIGHRGDGQFPDELCMLLNTLTLTRLDFDKLKSKGKVPKVELNQDSLQLLYAILVRRRAQYPDRQAPPVNVSASRLAMAATVIKGELIVLQEAADTVTEQQPSSSKRKADTFDGDVKAEREGSKRAK